MGIRSCILDPRIVGDLDDQRIESRDDARAGGWARSSVYLLRTRKRNGSLNKPGSTTVSGVTILLSLTVFLNLVAETLPQVSDAIPLLGTLSFYKQTCASVDFLSLLRMDVISFYPTILFSFPLSLSLSLFLSFSLNLVYSICVSESLIERSPLERRNWILDERWTHVRV